MSPHLHGSIFVSVVTLAATAVPAVANVTISNSTTQNMNCAAGICAPTAATAVLDVKDLESLLASGNVKVTTTGSGIQATNIRLTAKLALPSANPLTLDAYKSVIVDRPVVANGTGGLYVLTNDGGQKGEFSFGADGHVAFKNLSSPLSINGTAYTLVSSVSTLANAIAANPAGSYALANSYDASRDGTYTTSPVGTTFTGAFNGLGNTILNLIINDPTQNAYVGLFAQTSGNASLASVRLANATVTGGAGTQSSSTEYVGGLVGYQQGGTISNAFAGGTVSAGSYAAAGGLAGVTMGTVTSSGAAATTSSGDQGVAGGLIAGASGVVTNSYATGNVSGSAFIGGLVGIDGYNTIDHSFATGTVTGIDTYTYAGGLIGMNTGTVTRSFASGAVNCEFVCGGLAGMNGGGYPSDNYIISRSFSTGNVSAGAGGAGGLVGANLSGVIVDAYAIGSTSGNGAGGLVATNTTEAGFGGVARSYATGAVTGSQYAGGLIAVDNFTGSLKRDYWDTSTSGIANPEQGAGNVQNDPGIKGLSNAKFTSGLPKGFNPRIWTENADINGGLPYLIDNPPPK